MKIYQRRLDPIQVNSTPQQSNPIVIQAPSKLRATAKEFCPSGMDLTFHSGPKNLPQLSSQESEEADAPDEIITELRQSAESKSTADSIPAADDSMVTQTLCRICGCDLIPDSSLQEQEDTTSKTESSCMETFSQHCSTEQHKSKLKRYELFDNEEKTYYDPRKKALIELLAKSATLCKKDRTLNSIVESVEKDMKATSKEITRIRNSNEWEEGLRIQRNLSGELDMLYMKLEKGIEDSKKERLELEKDREFEAKIEEVESNDSEEEEAEEIKPARANRSQKIACFCSYMCIAMYVRRLQIHINFDT